MFCIGSLWPGRCNPCWLVIQTKRTIEFDVPGGLMRTVTNFCNEIVMLGVVVVLAGVMACGGGDSADPKTAQTSLNATVSSLSESLNGSFAMLDADTFDSSVGSTLSQMEKMINDAVGSDDMASPAKLISMANDGEGRDGLRSLCRSYVRSPSS